ncbi:SLC26A/SulP transporter family protein [Uliginosibacterium sp. H1]|uniref:SLC26A/SulP transporter family protein n=1 Tax=Uliginosibacterium sp. H1 TaxID=3114757 RepID=UPI002E198D24|nr:SulP family inorganic anion transporter [Uliginosibacterium sp. H1]
MRLPAFAPPFTGFLESWRSRLAVGVSAVSNAFEHAPENMAYGLLAFAALDPAFGPTAMAMVLLGTVIANVIASTLGSGRLVSGPRAALSLLTGGFVAALSSMLSSMLGSAGQASPAQVLTLSALGVACAGVLQAGFGMLKLGSIVKYTPHPVRVGVTSGVGLLLVITALPVVTGHAFGTALRTTFESPQDGAIAVGLCALVFTGLATRLKTRIPPVIIGLGVATALHFAMSRWLQGADAGALIGAPVLAAGGFMALDPASLFRADFLDPRLMALIGSYAITAAALCSLDSLIAVSVVDGRLRRSRDANRELCAQGLANIAAGLVSGQPYSPSMPRTLSLVMPNPDHRHVVAAYAVAMLALLLFAPQVIAQVPRSAVGGVILLQGLGMLLPVFWHAPLERWRQRGQYRQRLADAGTAAARSPLRLADWAVELAVAIGAVVFGLGPAVLIGAMCAVLLFVRANMRDVVRHEWSGETRHSLKARPPALAGVLAREGSRIAVLELQGALFFGTADGLRTRLEGIEASVDIAILDLHQVTEIDVTAARILFEIAQHWRRVGRALVFAEWPAGDARRGLVEAAGPAADRKALLFADHTDLALEQAEDRLLSSLKPDGESGAALSLADTMLGRDLTPDEIASLAGVLVTLHFRRGETLFKLGDPGDGLYVSLQGDIGLRIPGSARRLASFAPGVIIGEMASLARSTRSAEAVAESDVVALKLPLDVFDRLLVEQPTLATKLLKNMSLHLADRVRALTSDLSHWVARAAAGRVGPPAGANLHDAESIG